VSSGRSRRAPGPGLCGMGRRRFLALVGGGAAGLLVRRSGGAQDAPASRKPNIVIFLADDHGRFDTGCYGNEAVRTPHIDRLAREGMRFDSAFAPEGICAPSRSTLYTGLYPYRHGAYQQSGTIREGVKTLPQYLQALGYRAVLAGKIHVKPAAAFTFEHLAEDTCDSFFAAPGDRPFCFILASHYPHRPFGSKAKGIRYDPAQVKVPPYLVDTPELRKDMAANYGAVTAMDEQVGACLDSLKKHGLEGTTLFIYTSDQGQSYPFSKWTCYEAGLRVPFIVRWPGRVRPGTATDAMISFVDVVPLLVEAAGGKPPEGIDGRSFLPVLEGGATEHHDCVFGIYAHAAVMNAQGEYPIRSVRSRTHQYIRNLAPDRTFTNNLTASGEDARFWPSWEEKAKTDASAAARVRLYQHRPPEELYDLRADPYELKNVVDDPAQKPVLEALRKRLDEWMRQQGDPGEAGARSRGRGRGKSEDAP